MSVTDREIDKGGSALLQQATKCLEEVLGPSAGRVRAEWEQTRDERGRTLYVLRISGFPDQVSGTFAPAELSASGHLRSRLRDLWGDLLQMRSDAGVKRPQQLVREGLDGGEAYAR